MIEWFTRNPVAANLLMLLIIVGGISAIPAIQQKTFPDIEIEVVQVAVPYLGAAPEEVEQGVCVRIEEEIHGITGIERITENGVVVADGTDHELDVLILATGFHPFNFMRPMDLTGRDGLSIDDAWAKKVQAYRSLCIPGFPNFFLMLGPNAPIGNYSVIAMSEVQSKYVLKLIDHWRQGNLQTVEATEEAKVRYNDYLKAGMGKTVWVGGCQSWYLDADGAHHYGHVY